MFPSFHARVKQECGNRGMRLDNPMPNFHILLTDGVTSCFKKKKKNYRLSLDNHLEKKKWG